MLKEIKVYGNEGQEYTIKLKATAATFLHYKAQFGRDGLQDMQKVVKTDEDGAFNIDTEIYYGLLWSLAYSADKKIKAVDVWLDQFDVAPIDFIDQTFAEVVALLSDNAEAKQKGKN